MRISRIYLPLQLGQPDETLVIDGSKAHYLRNVLRVKPQQPLNFFTPEGIEYEAKISAVEKRQITLFELKASSQQPRPASIDTTLIQGISSSDRMDYTIQKAAELGCKKIIGNPEPELRKLEGGGGGGEGEGEALTKWETQRNAPSDEDSRICIQRGAPAKM